MLSLNSRTPDIQNHGGGLLTLIHKSINLSRRADSPDTLADSHLEELTITAKLGNTDLIITNVYIPPATSCTGGYNPSLYHLMMMTDTLILGDFNAHHSLWYSSSTDSRGIMLENMVSGSNFGILNWDSTTRLPGNANPSSPDVSLASASLIISTNWQTKTNLGSDHLPILISLQLAVTINPIQHRTSINGSNDSRMYVVEPPRGRSFIWQIGVNSSILDHRQVNRVFLWSRVCCTRQR